MNSRCAVAQPSSSDRSAHLRKPPSPHAPQGMRCHPRDRHWVTSGGGCRCGTVRHGRHLHPGCTRSRGSAVRRNRGSIPTDTPGGLRTRRRHPVGTWVAACLAPRFVRSRQWRDLRRSHALIVVVAAVVPAAIAIDVAGCSLLTTAAVTLVVASLLQAIAGDVFKIRAAAGALALPLPVAARLAALARLRHEVLSRRAAAAHEATDTSRRRRLNQPSSAGAGGTQLGKRIECFAVHAVSL